MFYSELQHAVHEFTALMLPLSEKKLECHGLRRAFCPTTVQIDKTLVAIGQTPTESKRLLRIIHAAFAEVEGLCSGVEKWTTQPLLPLHRPLQNA